MTYDMLQSCLTVRDTTQTSLSPTHQSSFQYNSLMTVISVVWTLVPTRHWESWWSWTRKKTIHHCVFAYPRLKRRCPANITGQKSHQNVLIYIKNKSMKVKRRLDDILESSPHITLLYNFSFLTFTFFHWSAIKRWMLSGKSQEPVSLRAIESTLYDDTWV